MACVGGKRIHKMKHKTLPCGQRFMLVGGFWLFEDNIQGVDDAAHAEEQEGQHQVDPEVVGDLAFLKKGNSRFFVRNCIVQANFATQKV